ncbi:MAG: hypothetical protein KC620_07075, partial [Myxococcales bacterium]|nr:hypothetical protein [Myxococcales bacterium]
MNMRTLAPTLAMALLAGCAPESPAPTSYFGTLEPESGQKPYATQFATLTVPATEAAAATIEAQVVDLIRRAQNTLDVAFPAFESQPIADALLAARLRGITVRVVGDADTRNQAGFRALDDGNLHVEFGDGAISWNGVFGADPILRTGDDNRMTHSLVIADRQRLLVLTGGFPKDADKQVRVGFAADSEELARDFGNAFDPLYGGVFSTTFTFYDQTVASDTNNRNFYPTEDGVVEAYFGPQEPLVKEIIDRIYQARASVHIATTEFKNAEIARALYYKAGVGFDVKVLVAHPVAESAEAARLAADFAAIRDARGTDAPVFAVNPAIGTTLVLIDGLPAPDGGSNRPGVAMVLTSALLASVPYAVSGIDQGG